MKPYKSLLLFFIFIQKNIMHSLNKCQTIFIICIQFRLFIKNKKKIPLKIENFFYCSNSMIRLLECINYSKPFKTFNLNDRCKYGRCAYSNTQKKLLITNTDTNGDVSIVYSDKFVKVKLKYLVEPWAIHVYDEEIFVCDDSTNTIYVYKDDENFDYIREMKHELIKCPSDIYFDHTHGYLISSEYLEDYFCIIDIKQDSMQLVQKYEIYKPIFVCANDRYVFVSCGLGPYTNQDAAKKMTGQKSGIPHDNTILIFHKNDLYKGYFNLLAKITSDYCYLPVIRLIYENDRAILITIFNTIDDDEHISKQKYLFAIDIDEYLKEIPTSIDKSISVLFKQNFELNGYTRGLYIADNELLVLTNTGPVIYIKQ